MNFEKLTESIFKHIGGQENIINLTHCATRLRFTLKDSSKVDEKALKKTSGILGVVNKGGQFQMLIKILWAK